MALSASLILVALKTHAVGCQARTFIYLAGKCHFQIFHHKTYFCSNVKHILSACVQSPAVMIISLVCCVGHSVPFHLFPFSCSSDVSAAFQASVACSRVTFCLSTFSSGEAMTDTGCSGLSLVFLENWLHRARLLCGGNCTALTTVFCSSGSWWSVVS